eukprot:TRINITY_DN3462_c0_g1_i2.p1 TRINITY_DN3462_c0_g1~~TRINITY_DN3462_c0_g1_i2.p1  ORF type:complete len:304 (+),score=42.44 TRINITY_DN3462_c0_g1_i2:118-912(+)
MMRLLFTPNPQAFYCYMETDDDEISLFVDDVSFELFPDEFFTIVDNDPWKVIQVVYPGGAKKIDTTGYINKLSETLSKVGIFTIFFSTFSSDMMIIKEESIDLAYELVSRIGLDSEDDSCDSEDDEEDFLASPLKPPLRILSFQINDLELFTAPLLKTFLNPKLHNRFLTVTKTGDEISLILNEKYLAYFSGLEDHYLIHASTWNPIEISPGYKGKNTGLISHVTGILALNKIPIYYQAAVADDFILVPISKTSLSMSLLKPPS